MEVRHPMMAERILRSEPNPPSGRVAPETIMKFRIALFVVALLPALASAQSIDLALRRFPAQFDAGVEAATLRTFAKIAEVELDAPKFSPPVRLAYEDGRPSPIVVHAMDVKGRGPIRRVASFLERMARRDWRAGELEALSFEDRSGEAAFAARFALPSYEPRDGDGMDDRRLAAMLPRFEYRRVARAVALMGSLPESHGIRLTALRYGRYLSVHGVAIGEAAREALRKWLQGQPNGASTTKIADAGACRPFAVEFAPWATGGEREQTRPLELDKADAALCEVTPPKVIGTAVARGGGDLHLRLGRAGLGAVAAVLHELGAGDFIVDSDARGALDVQAEGTSAAGLLAAMREAGVFVGEGPIRRIAPGKPRRLPPEQAYTGVPVSLAVGEVALADVLCVFNMQTGLEFFVPAGSADRISVFVREQPWDRVVAESIAAAGMAYAIEGTRVHAGDSRGDAGVRACEATSRPDPPKAMKLPLEAVSASDLELVGYAQAGDKWSGYAYAPMRAFVTLAPGTALFGSRVRSIDGTGVTFESAGRSFAIAFEPRRKIEPGSSSFLFTDVKGRRDQPMRVYTYRPARCDATCPLVIVVHGVSRNASGYRDYWRGAAERFGLVVVAPEFSRAQWPNFNHGASDGPRELWPVSVLEHLFDEVADGRKDYIAFGHSAGGQLVQRLALLLPDNRAAVIVAANPGWYLMPEWRAGRAAAPFPYSLAGSPVGEKELRRALQRRVVIMLGTNDSDPAAKDLNRSAGASAQGANRFERGKGFYRAASASAKELGVPFAWEIHEVPGVGHQAEPMSRAAAALLFDKGR
jgi:poly(3-hydroxybutyrate) depolymerase